MKLKMLVVMAISTLFAASFVCAAPATTQLADDTSSISSSNIASDQSTSTDTSASIDSTNTDNSTSNNNDDMSADTATGDDDY